MRSASYPIVSLEDDAWRPIIAAVARCGWLDIAKERLDREDKTHITDVGEWSKDAFVIADMWRKWGESK